MPAGMPHHLPTWLQPGGQAPKASASRWQAKARGPKAAGFAFGPTTPPRAKPGRRPRRREREDGLVLWSVTRLRTALVGKRPVKACSDARFYISENPNPQL